MDTRHSSCGREEELGSRETLPQLVLCDLSLHPHKSLALPCVHGLSISCHWAAGTRGPVLIIAPKVALSSGTIGLSSPPPGGQWWFRVIWALDQS